MAAVVQSLSSCCAYRVSSLQATSCVTKSRLRSLSLRAEQDGEEVESRLEKSGEFKNLGRRSGLKITDMDARKAKKKRPAPVRRKYSAEEWQAMSDQWDQLEREALGLEPDQNNKVVESLRQWGQWLVDKTREVDDVGPQSVAVTLLGVFCVWFFLLLVTAGVLRLPFNLPFLEY